MNAAEQPRRQPRDREVVEIQMEIGKNYRLVNNRGGEGREVEVNLIAHPDGNVSLAAKTGISGDSPVLTRKLYAAPKEENLARGMNNLAEKYSPSYVAAQPTEPVYEKKAKPNNYFHDYKGSRREGKPGGKERGGSPKNIRFVD